LQRAKGEPALKAYAWQIFVVILLAGCAPFTAVGGKLTLPAQGFEVGLPEGWYRAEDVNEALLLTRVGLPLQLIRIERVSVGGELPYIKKKFAPDMPPYEAGEIELDDLRATPENSSFELLERGPATVSGRPGFRLLSTWRTREGLRVKQLHYGFLKGKWVYRLIYQAAARYYFDRDLVTFELVRSSFRLLP